MTSFLPSFTSNASYDHLMHDSSYSKMKLFSKTYLGDFAQSELTILDFGSQSVDNSSMIYRKIFSTKTWKYIGADIVPGFNVDLVITDPYSWTEIESNSIDLLVSGQTFEHIEYFWVTMFEIGRVLKPGGVAVLIAPSSGFEHRYPVDCWRFYRDGFAALSKMINFKLLESFTDWGRSGDAIWADSIGIFQKPLWSEEESLAFKSKYAAAHEILPLGFNSTPLNEMHLTAEVSTLESLGSGRLTSDLGKIRTEDISQDLPIVTRLRLALGIVLEKKNVSLVNQLLRRTSKGSENSWGTNTNMLND